MSSFQLLAENFSIFNQNCDFLSRRLLLLMRLIKIIFIDFSVEILKRTFTHGHRTSTSFILVTRIDNVKKCPWIDCIVYKSMAVCIWTGDASAGKKIGNEITIHTLARTGVHAAQQAMYFAKKWTRFFKVYQHRMGMSCACAMWLWTKRISVVVVYFDVRYAWAVLCCERECVCVCVGVRAVTPFFRIYLFDVTLL